VSPRDVKCPVCGAEPGTWCLMFRGGDFGPFRRHGNVHAKRRARSRARRKMTFKEAGAE
jgi:hypothetical protein